MRRQTKAIVAISAFLLITALVGVNAATAAAPTVTIDAPTGVSYTSAKVTGTINPNGGPDRVEIYAESRPVGSGGWSFAHAKTIEGPEAEGTSPISIEADLKNLKPGTEHEVRFGAYSSSTTFSPEPNPTFTTLDVAAPVFSVDPATGVTDNSAELHATINPGGTDPAFDVHYQFEYTTDGNANNPDEDIAKEVKWTTQFAPAGDVPAGTGPVPVSGELKFLEPNTTYYVRVNVSNAGGTYSSSKPHPSFKTSALPPALESLPAATYPGGTAAALGGLVNPKNSPTTFWVEYGPTASYGTSVPASKDAVVGDKNKAVGASRLITGLTPETTYHFRVIAKNASGTVTGPDMTFETAPAATPVQGNCPNNAFRLEQGATFLPDCRAWEKVTPAGKGGIDVGGATYESKVRAAAAGGKLVFGANGQFGDLKAGGYPGNYYAERGASGWTTKSLLPPNDAKGGYLEWVPAGTAGRTSALVGVDDELTNFFIEANAAVAPGTFDGVPATYKQVGPAGDLSLVTPPGPDWGQAFTGLVSGRNAAPVFLTASKNSRFVLFGSSWDFETDTDAGIDLLYKADTATGVVEIAGILPGEEVAPRAQAGSLWDSMMNAVSNDGERVYFCVVDCYQSPASDLYLREGNETRLLTDTGKFWGATPDGSKVLYTSNAGLFVENVESGEAVNISEDIDPPRSARVVIGVAEDLSRVYFVAHTSPLVPGYQQPDDESRVLYVWSDDGGDGEIRYVADLTGFKEPMWNSVAEGVRTYRPNLPGLDNNPWAAAAADGGSLVFTAIRNVTGYDSGQFREVYVYDFDSDTVNCVSCPRGPASGHAQLVYPNQVIEQASTNGRPLGIRNIVSRDSKRVFFQTPEGLVAEDTNGVNDVYVYDMETESVRLLSSGTSSSPAHFAAASASGDEVFIATAAKLLRTDEDELVDIYSARVDGGFPLPAQPQPGCVGEACQGAAPAAPKGAAAASGLVAGTGNATPKRPTCVKPRKKSRKAARGKDRAGAKASASKGSKKRGKAKKKKKATCKPRAGK